MAMDVRIAHEDIGAGRRVEGVVVQAEASLPGMDEVQLFLARVSRFIVRFDDVLAGVGGVGVAAKARTSASGGTAGYRRRSCHSRRTGSSPSRAASPGVALPRP